VKQQVRTILEDKGSHVETIGPEATVADAVRRMNELRIGSLLVLEGERVVGMFTERDVLTRIVSDRRDPDGTFIRDVMTSTLITLVPTNTVEEALTIVNEKRIRHLPVMNGDQLVGMISIGDLTRSLIRHQQAEIQDLVGYIKS